MVSACIIFILRLYLKIDLSLFRSAFPHILDCLSQEEAVFAPTMNFDIYVLVTRRRCLLLSND